MIVALLLAQMAAVAPPTRFELSNGLRVWVQEEHSRPVALVHITYHAGSLNEGPGQTGIAHYVEHMAYRANRNIRNEDIYGYIDRIGGRYTGGTWPDVTRYAETVPSWALEAALRVTAERMTGALFDSLEFERERSNVVTEAHGFADTDPANALRDAVMMTAFELHPYRYNSNTWARDNLTLTRAQAYAWYRQHYGPNNAVLVIVGDVRTEDARLLVEKHFGSLPRASGTGRIDVLEPAQRAEKRVVMTEPSDSARLEIAYHAPSAHHPAFPAYARYDEAFAEGMRQAARRVDPSIRVEIKDTATAYPYVYRISVAAAPSVDMSAVLKAVDDAILRRPTLEVVEDVPDSRVTPDAGPLPASPSAVPPRRSNLVRLAEALAARELPPWEVSNELRDSIAARAARVTADEYQHFARQWLKPSNRTVGILQPALPPEHRPGIHGNPPPRPAPDTMSFRLDVPALTTPPAPRQRPEPVPRQALQPLAPLRLPVGRRVLPNGIPLRAAKSNAAEMLIRVVYDYDLTADTMERRFKPEEAEEAIRLAARDVASGRANAPEPKADTTMEGRARARVIAAVSTPGRARGPQRAALSVALVGPLDVDSTLRMAAKHFAALPRSRPFRERPPVSARAREELLPVAGAKQVEVVAGLPGIPGNHRDRRALELLNYIVGVPYYGGRLGWALTKTGLTYSSAAQTYFGESGYILLSTTADTRNAPAVLQAIREVVAGVGETGVEAWELEEAKAFMLGRTILYGAREDSPAPAIAAALTDSDAAEMELLDLPALSRAYLSVTLDDVNRVARAYYRPDRLTVVAMGAVPGDGMSSPFSSGTFRSLFEAK